MPDTSPSRPWWRHPAVGWAAALVTVRITGIVLFRSRRPAFLDAVRQTNKRILNPLMLHLAGHRHWYAARLDRGACRGPHHRRGLLRGRRRARRAVSDGAPWARARKEDDGQADRPEGCRHLLRRLPRGRGRHHDHPAPCRHGVHRSIRMREVDGPAHPQPATRVGARCPGRGPGAARRGEHLRTRRRSDLGQADGRHGLPAPQPLPRQIKIVQIAHDNEVGSLYLDDRGRVWFREVKTYGERPGVPETVVRWKQLELPDEPTAAAT